MQKITLLHCKSIDSTSPDSSSGLVLANLEYFQHSEYVHFPLFPSVSFLFSISVSHFGNRVLQFWILPSLSLKFLLSPSPLFQLTLKTCIALAVFGCSSSIRVYIKFLTIQTMAVKVVRSSKTEFCSVLL